MKEEHKAWRKNISKCPSVRCRWENMRLAGVEREGNAKPESDRNLGLDNTWLENCRMLLKKGVTIWSFYSFTTEKHWAQRTRQKQELSKALLETVAWGSNVMVYNGVSSSGKWEMNALV